MPSTSSRSRHGLLPGLDKLATGTSYGISIARLLEQAGSKKGVSTVLMTSLVFGIALSFAVTAVLRAPWGLVPGFAAGAAVPLPGAPAQADGAVPPVRRELP